MAGVFVLPQIKGVTNPPRHKYLLAEPPFFGKQSFYIFWEISLQKTGEPPAYVFGATCMSDEYVEYLKNDESRQEVALRLFDYARELLNWQEHQMLPGGIDPQNVVIEVIKRVASGKRKLNDRFPYEVQLKGMVRSIISKLYEKTDAKLENIPVDEDELGYARIEKALGVGGTESAFEAQEYSERFVRLVENHPKVQSDPDLGLVVLAYIDGARAARDAAEQTGIPISRVYEYNRSLQKVLKEVKAQMK